MIENISFQTGFPTKLPNIRKKKFEFKPGLNILFGPNGCGKSTILKTLAGRLGILNGGHTKIITARDLDRTNKDIVSNLSNINIKKEKVGCTIETDGSRGFYYRGNEITSENISSFFFHNEDMSPDGITSFEEQIAGLTGTPSHGTQQTQKIFKVLEKISKIPPKDTLQTPNPPELEFLQQQLWKNIPETEKFTILLDEPDNHLEIPFQHLFLLRVLPNLAKNHQIIVATHNPIALKIPKTVAHFVDFNKKYTELCRSMLESDFHTITPHLEKYKEQLLNPKK
jgi:predicted ATPase